MDATHIYCARCRAIRPVEFERLVASEASLGTAAHCVRCGWLALTMIGGFELFRGLDQYRMLVFGIAMVLLMIWRPRGLIGHRAPTVFLRHNQAISSDLVKEGHG